MKCGFSKKYMQLFFGAYAGFTLKSAEWEKLKLSMFMFYEYVAVY